MGVLGMMASLDGDIHWEGGGQEEVSHKVPPDNLWVDAAKLKPGGRQRRSRRVAFEGYWVTVALACGGDKLYHCHQSESSNH